MVRKVITHIKYPVLLVIVVFCLLGLAQAVFGSNIDPTDKWAWGVNVGWIDFAPAGYEGVTVYADHLEGYAWGENVGWIRMGAHTGGGSHTYTNTTSTNYGVNVDGSGNLSGYAWGTNVGWIDFDPVGDEQVTIDLDSGEFDGYAWGENIGWIHCKGTAADATPYNVVVNPDLEIAKQATARVNPGGTVTYTLVFTNNGPVRATGIVITDRVPVSVTVTSRQVASSVDITATGSISYVWEVENLNAYEVGVITITGVLSDPLPGGHIFGNHVEIAADADSDSRNDSSDANVTVTDAQLEITKKVSDSTPDPGATILYTVIVTNSGPDDATGVVVSDTLPVSITNVSFNVTQGEYVNPVWDVGDLGVGVSATLRITGTVRADAPDGTIIANTAVISASDQGDSGPPDDRDDDAVIIVHGAELAVVKTVDDYTPREGYTVTYAITVTNDGFTSTVVISDLLPSGVSCVLSSTTQGDYTPASGAWDVGELVENGSVTLHITATVDAGAAGTIITNTTAVSTTSLADPDPGNDWDDAFIHAQAANAVIVIITPEGGGRLVYTDTQGLTTTVEVPTNAMTDPVTLIYTPLPTADPPPPAGLLFAGHAFNLDIYLEGVLQPGFAFTRPVTIAIHYSDEDVAGLIEDELVLMYWNGESWEDAACDDYAHRAYHPDENWMAVPICHLTPFALLGPAFPVGGVTLLVDVLASSWLWIALAALVATGAIAAAALKRRTA